MQKIYNAISKYWFHLHIAFLLAAVIYSIITYQPLEPGSALVVYFDVLGFLGILLGFGLLISTFFYKKYPTIIKYVVFIIAYIMFCLSFIKQNDPQLSWPTSDVAKTNFDIANEVTEMGPWYIFRTWNARANPFDDEGYRLKAKSAAREYINQNNLVWLAGKKWDEKNLNVDKQNNRPYYHPPLASLIMGLWLYIFPFGRWSLEILMLILTTMSFILVIYSLDKQNILLNNYPIIFALITIPTAILNLSYPSAESFTMLLTSLSVYIQLKNEKHCFSRSFLAGVLIMLAFYSKFVVAFYITFQLISYLVYRKKIGLRPFLGYISGCLIIFLIFTFAGYYFWLTYLIGTFINKDFIMNNPTGLLESLSKYLFFGPTILLLIASLYLSPFYKIFTTHKNSILYPLLITIIAITLYLLDLGTFNRYIMIYIPALCFFMPEILDKLNLSVRNRIIIPVANLILFSLIIYL